MKMLVSILSIIFIGHSVIAQNVGIGTGSPASKLHLVGNFLQESGTITLNNTSSIIQFQNIGVNKAFLQLSGDNLRLGTNSGNQLGKTIFRLAGQDRVIIDSTGNLQIIGSQDASLTSHGYLTLGILTGNNLILDGNEIMARQNGNPDNLILQNDGGNLGIGVASPTAKLHVNGDVKITDGTEGSGRVLTSDASGNASWQNAAFSNNDRIMVRYTGKGSDSLIDGTTTLYDNGSITYNNINTRFTVLKSGLYHFEGTTQHIVAFVNPPTTEVVEMAAFVSVNGGSPIALGSFYEGSVSTIYAPIFVVPFKIDIYLAAGSYVVFKIKDYNNNNSVNTNAPGHISAYLISE